MAVEAARGAVYALARVAFAIPDAPGTDFGVMLLGGMIVASAVVTPGFLGAALAFGMAVPDTLGAGLQNRFEVEFLHLAPPVVDVDGR
jgi:uncharacterized membrane protein